MDDLLGSNEEVTEKNVLQYLGIIEERTNQILYIQAYVRSRKVGHDSFSGGAFVKAGNQRLCIHQGWISFPPKPRNHFLCIVGSGRLSQAPNNLVGRRPSTDAKDTTCVTTFYGVSQVWQHF